MQRIFWLIAAVLVAACSQEELLQKFSKPEDQKAARAFIDRLRAHDFDSIDQAIDPSVRTPALRGTLEKMAALIPSEPEQSVKLIGAQRYQTADAVTVNSSFEYAFRDKWILVNVAVRTAGEKKTIVGFNVYPESRSLEETNRFSFEGRGTAQYVVLAAAIVAVALSIYALLACVRTKTTRKKWPWIAFILVGFGRLAVNWTTGQLSFSPLHVALLSAGAFAPTFGPWTVAVSLPIGAILFLAYGQKRLAAQTASASRSQNASAPE